MPRFSTYLRAVPALLVAAAICLTGTPAAVAGTPSTAAAPDSPAARSGGGATRLELHGDVVRPAGSARAGTSTWKGRTLAYYETIPGKWDWSLSTAVAKWNEAGGNLKLVPTTTRSRADVVISYGNTSGAAGLATVGATSGAFVRLNPSYDKADALDAWNRVAVMAVFTHEIGHVLGYQHTTATCSLMRAVLDISGCYMAPASLPGYYRCRTIDPALVVRFVSAYGGKAHYPGSYCLVDALPSQLSGVGFSGGVSSPVSVRWAKPTSAPSGSVVQVRAWSAATCGTVPSSAETFKVSPSALAWTDRTAARAGQHCFSVNLVNRYGAGRTPVAQVMTRWAAPAIG